MLAQLKTIIAVLAARNVCEREERLPCLLSVGVNVDMNLMSIFTLWINDTSVLDDALSHLTLLV